MRTVTTNRNFAARVILLAASGLWYHSQRQLRLYYLWWCYTARTFNPEKASQLHLSLKL